jgi:hypothetical protein
MKRFSVFVFCIVTFAITSSPRCQSAVGSDSWKNVTLGPFFMPGASVEAGTVATGAKTNMQFSWCLGAVSCFPFSPSFGLQLAVCYDDRAVGFYDQNNSNNYINYTFSYFSLRPEFMIGDFLIGLGIGIPVGASTTAGGTETAPTLGSSSMNPLIEGRIGASIPVVVADNGNSLRFMIDGSYAFSQITSGPLQPAYGSTDKTKNNGPFGTLQLGFAYLFNLNPH